VVTLKQNIKIETGMGHTQAFLQRPLTLILFVKLCCVFVFIKIINPSRWRHSWLRGSISGFGESRANVRWHGFGPRQHRDRVASSTSSASDNSTLPSVDQQTSGTTLHIIASQQVRTKSLKVNVKHWFPKSAPRTIVVRVISSSGPPIFFLINSLCFAEQ
jgi:hypothetical protein